MRGQLKGTKMSIEHPALCCVIPIWQEGCGCQDLAPQVPSFGGTEGEMKWRQKYKITDHRPHRFSDRTGLFQGTISGVFFSVSFLWETGGLGIPIFEGVFFGIAMGFFNYFRVKMSKTKELNEVPESRGNDSAAVS
jgi:hypothetical protein